MYIRSISNNYILIFKYEKAGVVQFASECKIDFVDNYMLANPFSVF